MSSSFNNFHGRLKSLFHVLSDDKMGSAPRFKPGSPATKERTGSEEMDVEVVNIDGPSAEDETPGTPKSSSTKRKLSPATDEGASSASKLRPRR
jgi:hypothetical protein